MSDTPTRDELERQATEAGVTGVSGLNKQELQDAIAAKQTEAAGPHVAPGESEPAPPEPSGEPTPGVQPLTEDEIPEAGR